MLETLIDNWGDGVVLAVAGAVVGVVFGAMAQHSRFCLRAATVELTQAQFGPRLSIWFIAFSAAVLGVQGAIMAGILDVSQARSLAASGSLSGAVIGGLMFGCGMILARGCASRLLILSATGNLRALVTGLVLTLVAQASLRGALSPVREGIAGIWVVEGGAGRNLLSLFSIPSSAIVVIAAVLLCASMLYARRQNLPQSQALAAAGVGGAVAVGWVLTYAISQNSFEVIPISSVTFTGPSTDTLMGLVNSAQLPMGFGVGLVPGVFFGAGVTALITGEAKIARFEADSPMERYLLGAALMGFGSMLAGGCAVGAGMSGGAIFALTAWVALFSMWVGAMATQHLTTVSAQAVNAKA
jgi:uncharacterized membrane protein YedE/YeeE